MFRRLSAIIRKDTLVRFSSRSEILFFLILPIVFTAILGGLNFADEGGDNRVPLATVNEDEQPAADELLAVLAESPAVRIEVMGRAEAESAFEDGEVPALLIIPSGFSTNLEAGRQTELEWRAAPSNSDALIAEQEVRAAVGRIGRALAVANTAAQAAQSRGALEDEASLAAFRAESRLEAQEMLADAPNRLEVTMLVRNPAEEEFGYDQAAQASAGQLLTWVFIPLLGVSGLFAFERSQGTLRRLLTTSAPKSTMLAGTISSQLLLALVQMFLLIAFGIAVFQVNWGDSPGALVVLLFTFALAAVAMGTMLGTFIKTEGQATGISISLGMVMALLGGCWYPLELFPPAVATAMHVLPTTWAMQGLTELMMLGGDLQDILLEAAVLLGFALVFFVVGVRRFRYE